MKLKTTRKEIYSRARKVYKVGYCDVQHLFRSESPMFYWCGVSGWYCDIYYLGDGVYLTTGYNPFGKSVQKLADRYEQEAKKLDCWNEQDRQYLENLKNNFIRELLEQ